MKISPVNQSNFDRRALQLLRGGQPAESAAENDDSMFFPHSFSPKRNLVKSSIISSTVIFSRLMRRIRWQIPTFIVLFAAFIAAYGATSPLEGSRRGEPGSGSAGNSPVIVVGFVGGFVRHDNPVHSEVKLARRLRTEYPEGVYVEVFENRHGKKALHAILGHLGANDSDTISEDGKRAARIILYGHSWGGSAVVHLARDLEKRGIPVLLTIQVDSITHGGQHDGVIPPNVARAANFYQPNGMVHGRSEIRAQDPSRTQIIGNFRFEYKQHPVDCPEYPWYDHAFTKTHMEIACDPKVWSQVEALIRQQIGPNAQ